MKYLFTCLLLIVFFSCQKEFHNITNDDDLLTAKVLKVLKDSLSANNYSQINFDAIYKSIDVDTNYRFVRVGFLNKNYETDFILLKTDIEGKLIDGKIINVNCDNKVSTELVSYSCNIYWLNNNLYKRLSPEILLKYSSLKSKIDDDGPAGEQTLPPVVVKTQTLKNETFYYYSYNNMVGSSSFGNTFLYGRSQSANGTSGHGTSGGAVTGLPINNDDVVAIEFENGTSPDINLALYLKCFDNVPDKDALYSISIFSDIPANANPNLLFDYSTGSVGHTFLKLFKKSGSISLQQYIGFYPKSGIKSIMSNSPVPGKFVDNAGHEFNASLTVNLSKEEFMNAITQMKYLSKLKYDIDNFNCTNYALEVFNLVAPKPLNIPMYTIPGSMIGEASATPQGLYNELISQQQHGSYNEGLIQIPKIRGFAGKSHGPCY